MKLQTGSNNDESQVRMKFEQKQLKIKKNVDLIQYYKGFEK